MRHKSLLLGFIRLHVLHHAAEEPVYGNWIIEELNRHGYRISPGTLYPMLHALEREGYLTSTPRKLDARNVRMYRITPTGRRALAEAKTRIKELFDELIHDA